MEWRGVELIRLELQVAALTPGFAHVTLDASEQLRVAGTEPAPIALFVLYSRTHCIDEFTEQNGGSTRTGLPV